MRPMDAASLGPLRRQSGLEVCQCEDALWLRIRVLDEELDATIRALPGTRFAVLSDQQLVPAGAQVPTGHLPEGPWTRLSEWMTVRAEPAAFCGRVTDRLRLRIVRGGYPAEANVLLTTVDRWRDYAVAAPQIRLDQWAFAVSGNGQVVIRGTPLPPLRGTRFVESSAVATPAGWTWSPPVAIEVVRAVLGLKQDDLALMHADGSWHHILGDDFVRATRSAVRLSVGGANDG